MRDWDKTFLNLAHDIAKWSKDKSTKVGAVIVEDKRIISVGYNGFPRGSNDDLEERHERPLKYKWSEHSERNAIYNAAANGHALTGTTLYCTMFPCTDCARGIIQSGIIRVVSIEPDLELPIWGEHFKVSLEMFSECGVTVKTEKKE